MPNLHSSSALVIFLRAPVMAGACFWQARDWEDDTGGAPFLGKDQFFNSWFQLADLMVPSLSAEVHVRGAWVYRVRAIFAGMARAALQ